MSTSQGKMEEQFMWRMEELLCVWRNCTRRRNCTTSQVEDGGTAPQVNGCEEQFMWRMEELLWYGSPTL